MIAGLKQIEAKTGDVERDTVLASLASITASLVRIADASERIADSNARIDAGIRTVLGRVK